MLIRTLGRESRHSDLLLARKKERTLLPHSTLDFIHHLFLAAGVLDVLGMAAASPTQKIASGEHPGEHFQFAMTLLLLRVIGQAIPIHRNVKLLFRICRTGGPGTFLVHFRPMWVWSIDFTKSIRLRYNFSWYRNFMVFRVDESRSQRIRD